LVELGVLSLGDLQRDQRTGRRHRPVDRMAEILGYAVLDDQLGLDVFAIGEHHSAEFFVSSPAVVLAAGRLGRPAAWPGRGVHRPLRHRHRARPARRLTHKAGTGHDFDTKGKRHA
jgi:hypothetical protein